MAGDWDVVDVKPVGEWDVVSHEDADARNTVVPYANAKVPGMAEQGNVELWDRPAYLHDDYKKSGSYGTTESFSREDEDGKEVLVPRIIDGKRLTLKDAWDHYKKTGEHLGKFDDPDSADQYATALHNAQATYINSKGGPEKFVKHDPDSWLSGIPANAIAGGIDAITGIPAAAGWMADRVLSTGRYRLGRPGADAHPDAGAKVGQGVTDYINESLPVNPDKDVQAANTPERMARFGGGSIVGAFTPGGEATALQRLGSGARFAIGGGAAQELVPDWAKPYAAMIGGVGADLAGSLGWRAAKGTNTAAVVSDDISRARAKGVIEKAAGDNIDEVKAKTAAGRTGGLPGAEGSFFQDTRAPGIGILEDQLSTKDPAAFEALRQKQEADRQSALNTVQPKGQGAHNDLQNHIIGQIDDADANMSKAANSYVADAQKNAAANGGNKTPEAYGDDLRKEILKAHDAREAVAKKNLNVVGKDETGNTVGTIDAAKAIRDEADKYGATLDGDEAVLLDKAARLKPVDTMGKLTQLRSDVSDAMREELDRKGSTQKYRRLTQLRGAIEKNMTDTIAHVFTGNITSPASSEAAELMRGIDKDTLAGAASDVIDATGAPPRPESLFDVARGMPGGGIKPSIVGGKETSESAAVRARLPLNAKNGKGATWQDLMETLNQRGWLKHQPQAGEHPDDLIAALDQEASGKKFYHPEDDTAARLQHRDAIEQEMNEAGITANDKHVDKVAKLANYRAKQRNMEDVVPGFEPTRQDPSKPTSVVKPTVTEGNVKSFRTGSAQYKLLKRTFGGKGPVADTLRRAGGADVFNLPESSVPQKFFKPGPGGFQSMQKLYEAIGKDKAVPIIADYAASSLNKAAMREDGTIDPAKFGRWKAKHADSIRALPPDIQAKFDTASTATEWADQANVSRETAAKEANQGAIGKIMRAGTPQEITNVIKSVFDQKVGARDTMRDLASRASSSPAAAQGLREAAMDYIKGTFLGSQDQLKGATFQKFVREKADVLGEVFKPNEVANIRAVADDLKHTNAVVPVHGGGPATARRNWQVGSGAPKSSLRVIMDSVGGGLGSAAGYAALNAMVGPVAAPVIGGFTGVAIAETRNALKDLATQKIDKILTKAFTNTEFRRELLQSGSLESAKKIMQRSIAGRVLNR